MADLYGAKAPAAMFLARLAEVRTFFAPWLNQPADKGGPYYDYEVLFRVARDGEEAAALARQIGYPVALKILSPDISHKSDVGGVQLNLRNGYVALGPFPLGQAPRLILR